VLRGAFYPAALRADRVARNDGIVPSDARPAARLPFLERDIVLVFLGHGTAIARRHGAGVDRMINLLLPRHRFGCLFLLRRSLLRRGGIRLRGRWRWRRGGGRRRGCLRRGARCPAIRRGLRQRDA